MAFSVVHALSEFLAQTLFVFTCTGSAAGVANTPGWVLQVSLTFGFCITALAYAIGSKSGGQINGAVTIGLMVAGELDPIQGVANIVCQLGGSMLGSGLLSLIYRKSSDMTGGLGTNAVGPGFSARQAFLGEAIMTFILMYVVFETAVNKKNAGNAALAPVAIGFAVFLGHCVLIPIDGCSINPTRSFGPAVVASSQNRGANPWQDFWVFVLGPIAGAVVAAVYYKVVSGLEANEDTGVAEPAKAGAPPKADEIVETA
jgi:MIP family channel proteins